MTRLVTDCVWGAALLEGYIGPLGVYGDVQDMLQYCMEQYKGFVEEQDLDVAQDARAEDREHIKYTVDETNKAVDVTPPLPPLPPPSTHIQTPHPPGQHPH